MCGAEPGEGSWPKGLLGSVSAAGLSQDLGLAGPSPHASFPDCEKMRAE